MSHLGREAPADAESNAYLAFVCCFCILLNPDDKNKLCKEYDFDWHRVGV